MRAQSTYVERWSGVRLWIYRTRSGTISWSVIRRGSDNATVKDVQLARGQAPCAPGSWASRSVIHALLAALVASYGDSMVAAALDELLEEQAASPSGGPQGESHRGPLTGPLP